jgi:hypothetical protein
MSLVLKSAMSRRIAGKGIPAYHEPMDAAPEIVETSYGELWRRVALSPLALDERRCPQSD